MYKVWHCDFCGEGMSERTDAIKHEKECVRNPKAKNCLTCEFLKLSSDSADPYLGCNKNAKNASSIYYYKLANMCKKYTYCGDILSRSR
jgi:hypothetical protein